MKIKNREITKRDIVFIIILAIMIIYPPIYTLSEFKKPVEKLLREIPAGTVIDFNEIRTDSNDRSRSYIKTTTDEFVIFGTISDIKNKKAMLRIYDSGDYYLCIENINECNTIIRY